ncbi:MAG: hypothetical protein RBJ76_06195 [Stenomitos frigidus ULC029]
MPRLAASVLSFRRGRPPAVTLPTARTASEASACIQAVLWQALAYRQA